jgi:hypothetical protein
VADVGPVDLVTIQTVGTGVNPPVAFQSRDLQRIRAILDLVRGPGSWAGTWHTFPGGEVHLGFHNGAGSSGAAWFGRSVLLARADTETRMRDISPEVYDSLRALTIWWPPSTSDYVTFDTLTGPPAPIDYAFLPDARRFRSQLESATKATFAGHYTFVTWGCGTQCEQHYLLDLRTGRVYSDTLLNFSCGTVTYDVSSALVIASSAGPAAEGCPDHLTRYLAWQGTEFVPLDTPWRFDYTLGFLAQRPPQSPSDSSEERTVLALMRLRDSAAIAKRVTPSTAARLASGELVPVADPDDPPPDATAILGIERDSAGALVRAWEVPVSISGDHALALTHYFDAHGLTVAVEQYAGHITGCALDPDAAGGEGEVVGAAETATWIFTEDGRLVVKSFRRTGGADQRDLTAETNCVSVGHELNDKYRSVAAWLNATGMRRFLASRR